MKKLNVKVLAAVIFISFTLGNVSFVSAAEISNSEEKTY